MTVEIGLTVLIVAAAAAWTGRRLWRSVRRPGEPTAGCGAAQSGVGGCGSCPMAGSAHRTNGEDPACADNRPGGS
jgi:hypothetical protein